jgi:uncharacterized protein with von Willebrand factor type A (vWA) domain
MGSLYKKWESDLFSLQQNSNLDNPTFTSDMLRNSLAQNDGSSHISEITEEPVEDFAALEDPSFSPQRHVLIAIDGSDNAKQAFYYAIKHVLHKDSDLVHIINVRPESQALLAQGGSLGRKMLVAPS